ncbi:glycoside hydrolase family 72 protein [Lasiosphaeria miniovina]|uniref:1,3-beta-glucanosyltransferase n=1 Tax=Lasiosphaeria miniovina TaxID=1954250 RepID=A0AA40ATY1_9PEZI|nr:glycoside hydrolase family 72 protein [Lasiosphaeria miniovina]KAK0721960.1 glycoside hydrolase family 72 protein [Lasiosphaeria miniovina]
MRSFALVSALAAVSAVQAGPTKRASITSVTTKGNAFFVGDDRFYIRGVDYQPGGSAANVDPLADKKICEPDIEKFKKLGVNVVRVYSTDNSLDHTDCMNALSDAGIYVVLDANNPLYSINRENPGPSYNAAYLQSVFATIDAFIKFDNTLGFFSGNEVIHDNKSTTLAARYVKATTRDMRQYIRARGYRHALVGYSAADVTDNRMQTAAYFNCGTDDERSDFFAFNDYSWCSSDFVTSGWDKKVQSFSGYGLPIFLSEYGCNANVRDFGEVNALMSDKMTSVYSGGLLYEYTYEENKYGIVNITTGRANLAGPRVELDEFAAFAKALKNNPAPTGTGGYNPSATSQPCPTKDTNWIVETTLLPALPDGAKKFLTEGAGKGPGLKGAGSQNAGGSSTTDAAPGSGTSGVTAGAAAGTSSKAAGVSLMAPLDKAPFIISGIVAFFTLAGAFAL